MVGGLKKCRVVTVLAIVASERCTDKGDDWSTALNEFYVGSAKITDAAGHYRWIGLGCLASVVPDAVLNADELLGGGLALVQMKTTPLWSYCP